MSVVKQNSSLKKRQETKEMIDDEGGSYEYYRKAEERRIKTHESSMRLLRNRSTTTPLPKLKNS